MAHMHSMPSDLFPLQGREHRCDICDSEWANNAEMSYVSISRARSRFYMIGNIKDTLMQKALQTNYLASLEA